MDAAAVAASKTARLDAGLANEGERRFVRLLYLQSNLNPSPNSGIPWSYHNQWE
jgi:hypothetical protein